MRFSRFMSCLVALVWLALVGLSGCKRPKPQPQVDFEWHRPEEPNDELFEEFENASQVWPIFLEMIDTTASEEQLVSIFASAASGRRGSLQLGEPANGTRWRELAMATKDLRKRELYRIWGEKSCRDGLHNFYQYAFEAPAGTHVPFHADSSQVRFQRTLMRLGPGFALSATDQVDTLSIEEKSDHEFFASKPLTRGLWRLTALDVPGFREWFLNVDGIPVHTAADADSFEVWTGMTGNVHVKEDSAWRTFLLRGDRAFRHVLQADTIREKRVELVVESEGRLAFREIHLPRRSRERWVRSAVWTDQACHAPEEPARIHGVLGTMRRDGWLETGSAPSKVRLELMDQPVEVQTDADGHFHWVSRESTGVGNRTAGLDVQVPSDWIRPPRPNDPNRDPWWTISHGLSATQICRRDTPVISLGSSESTRPWRGPSMGAVFDKDLYREGEQARLLVWLRDSTGFVADDRVQVQIRQGDRTAKHDLRLRKGRADLWIPMTGTEPYHVGVLADRVTRPYGFEATARVVPADSLHPPREALLSVTTDRQEVRAGTTVRVVVRSVLEGASVFLQTRGARLGPAAGGVVTGGVFEARIPVEDLGGSWRLNAYLRTPTGIRTQPAMARLLDEHRAVVGVVGSRGDGRLAIQVKDALGRSIRARLTVSVTTEPSFSPSLESFTRLDTFPDAGQVWKVFQPRSLLAWRLPYPFWRDPEWFPGSRREEMPPEEWPREKVRHPVNRPELTDPEDPEASNFDPSLTVEEIAKSKRTWPETTNLVSKPRSVAYYNEDVRTSAAGNATISLKPLPPGVWWVVVRGTAEGGRVVNFRQMI